MTVTLTKYPAPLLNKIGSYVCQAVIYIQQQQPELLLDKYRNISWRDNSNQSRLKTRIIEKISNAEDWESLVKRVEVFIKALLISNSTNTPVLIKLQEKIRQLDPNISDNDSSHQQNLNSTNQESNIKTVDASASDRQSNIQTTLNDSENKQYISSKKTNQESLPPQAELKPNKNHQDINSLENQQQTGITVLLLDAENIQISLETEQFLTTVCNYPIQIKIAFANWQSMGKKDIEFHNRGYDLIHVPGGKDNAEGKTIAFGSTIYEYYPKVKEVLVLFVRYSNE